MKSNKGFTLIELLAVIVILAIIALIATPLTLNVINSAKTKAAENSAYGVLDAAKLYYAEAMMDDTKMNKVNKKDNAKVTIADLSVSGDKPSDTTLEVTYNTDGTVTIPTMAFDNGCYSITSSVVEAETCS